MLTAFGEQRHQQAEFSFSFRFLFPFFNELRPRLTFLTTRHWWPSE
jgi:hypothetical protein